MTPTQPVVVLVCGERLRRDDGAALLAAEGLDPGTVALAEISEIGQLSVDALLEVPLGAPLIVADAAVGIAAGQVVVLPLAEIVGRAAATPASSHSLPPDQVLALAEEMRGAPLDGVFVGIGGAEFSFGEELSEPVAAALPTFSAAMASEIRRFSGR